MMEPTKESLQELLLRGEILKLEQELQNVTITSKELHVLSAMIQVFRYEVKNHVQNSVFDYSLDIDKLTEHYTRLKIYLYRLDFGLSKENREEIYKYIEQNKVSDNMLLYCVEHNMFHPEKVLKGLAEMFYTFEDTHSLRARLFADLERQMLDNGGDE